MFRRNLVPPLIGVMFLSGMFLLGQETWQPSACVDNDRDGYGNPASASCPKTGWDCNDSDPAVNSGVTEVQCNDGVDNDCDGSTDAVDPGCWQCSSAGDCEDGSPCTDDSCVNHACVHTNNVSPCDDGNALTAGDTCSGGICVGRPPLNCDDGNVCTDDSFAPAGGCVHTNNLAPCDDGVTCTTDRCKDGACVGLAPDRDRDRHGDIACGGDDCDDTRDDVYAGARELSDGMDNDCDRRIDEGNRLPGAIPDTGVSRCFDSVHEIPCPAAGEPFYGQDADYATCPMEFSVNPDGLTVKDKATGLTWQREDDNVKRDWVAAVFYCRNLELAGSSAWHLPNPYELQSIVRYDRVNPAIDVAAFPGTDAEPYWSSSNVANGTDQAWVVYFYNGYVNGLRKTEQGFVRCVR